VRARFEVSALETVDRDGKGTTPIHEVDFVFSVRLSGWLSRVAAMLGAPFRARAAHVVQAWPVAVAHVHYQVGDDLGEGGGCISRVASEI